MSAALPTSNDLPPPAPPPIVVFVTGATGLLGRAILSALSGDARFATIGAGWSRVAPSTLPRVEMVKIDLTSAADVSAALARHAVSIVIHAAAERRPDVCEKSSAVASSLNIDAVWTVGSAASRAGAAFISISTDYVFDGSAPPYDESSRASPLNEYARQKLRGEFAALAAHADAIVLRVPVLFGPSADVSESAITVFASTVVNAAAPATLDDWQIRVPTFTPDVARTLHSMCLRLRVGAAAAAAAPLRGIFHYSSADKMTRYTVALAIARVLAGADGAPLPTAHISSSSAPPPGAPRPRDASLSCERLVSEGLFAPPTPFLVAMESVLRGPLREGLLAAAKKA